jgi:hypothetical protein
MRLLAMAPAVALALIGLTACGGGKSAQNAAQNAASTAQNAAQTAASSAGNAANSMANTAKNSMESAAGAMAAPNCGAVKAVWVNLNSKAYHEPGDPYYGKTKNGKYMCPSAAKAAGFHPAGSHAMTNESMGSTYKKHAGSMSGNAPMEQSTP